MANANEISDVSSRLRPAVEWPTVALAAGLYLAFGLVTWYYHALPWWLVLPFGAYLVCLHGSLQHEVVHGHPTRWRWVNAALVLPSLWLWLPHSRYREIHLTHHRDENLTDPLDDPESSYVSAAQWARMGPLTRLLRQALMTLAGRLLLGPPYYVALKARELLRAVGRGDRRYLAHWPLHLAAVAVTLVWVVGVCRIPFGEYVLFFAYPGISLTLLRSYAEHRAAAEVGHRTAVVESGPFFSLLFLNNNLHVVHHAEPGVAWYALPALYRRHRDRLLAINGGYLFHGYREIFARFLLRRRGSPVHPLAV
jgi:fatty acid desaturase